MSVHHFVSASSGAVRRKRRSIVLRYSPGQFIVELLVAMGLMLLLLPTLTYALIATRESEPQKEVRAVAWARMQETYEALRSIRERGWSYVATNGTYYPTRDGTQWILTPGSETADGLTRSVVVSDVYRDATGDVVSSASGTLDPSTKKITTNVQWTTPVESMLENSWFISRYLQSASVTQTTEDTFLQGSLYSLKTTNNAGGEISLSNNNKAKWCSPALSSTSIDLPDGPPVAVAATAAQSTDEPNDVFVATAPSTSSSIKMAYVNVTANQDTPTASLRGIFTLNPDEYSDLSYVPTGVNLDNVFKTNDIKYYKSAGGSMYALMATDLPDKEVVVARVNDGATDTYQDPVNHVYEYWTYYNTKIYDAAYNNPSANSPESSNAGDNNGYETSASSAYTLDGSTARDRNSGSGTGTSCAGTDKDKHRYYDFDLSIPSGATIEGIETQIVARADSTSGSPSICVQLSWDGGTTWTTTKSTPTLSTSLNTYTLGGSADTWGRTWSDSDFTNANFRVRLIDVSSNTSRDFYLDYVGLKVHYDGVSSAPNDHDPFGQGPRTLTVIGDRGYVAAGGYLYVFDLSTIDAKSPTSSLDQLGCRIQLDGYDCSPGTGVDRKYAAGETGSSWSDTTGPAHLDCSDGGNIELFATNHLDGVSVSGSTYIYVAVGAGTNPEFEIVNATSVPDGSSSPAINNNSCGRISGGNSGWKVISSLDFNSQSGTEEAANSVYAKSDGTRAFISSNGGIDGNNNGQPDSKQWYIINTSNKSSPAFLSGTPLTGATSGFYESTSAANLQLYPRRSLTVLNGERAILVGQDGIADGNDAQEYQVLNIDTEATPLYCGGVNYDQGFNDLTSVSEADGDNFVYMVANTIEKQLKIIEGGPDTGIYVPSGTFESSVIESTESAAFNRFTATVTTPTDTTVRMQVAAAARANGSCLNANYTYIGPNGTNSYGTDGYYYPVNGIISGMVPFGQYGQYTNPNECFRYKVYLDTTNTDQTPEFLDMTVNLSP